jgi:toxin ParE1/3/4
VVQVRLAPGVIDDLDRILDHLHQHEVEAVEARVDQIISALDVLAHNPRIGRLAGDDRRDLLIGREAHGYVALYRYLPMKPPWFSRSARNARAATHEDEVDRGARCARAIEHSVARTRKGSP